MTDEEFMKFMEEEGVDEACRRAVIEAWHKVQKLMWEESKKKLN